MRSSLEPPPLSTSPVQQVPSETWSFFINLQTGLKCFQHSSHTHQTSGLVLSVCACVCETLCKSCDVSFLACFHVDVCFNPQGHQ